MVVRVPGRATTPRTSQGPAPIVNALDVSVSFPAHALALVLAVAARGSSVFISVVSVVDLSGLVVDRATLLLHALPRRERTLLLLLASALSARLRGSGLRHGLRRLRLDESEQRNDVIR